MPPEARAGRRASIPTLSFDTHTPPPADLEHIHETSAKSPGLTTFDLTSPGGGGTEQLVALNKLFSGVKSVAASFRVAVGSGSGAGDSPTTSTFGTVGSDAYYRNSGSRDSFVTTATAGTRESEDASQAGDSLSRVPNWFRRLQRGGPKNSTTIALRRGSVTSNASGHERDHDYRAPPTLRRLAVSGSMSSNPSLAPITVFRGHVDDGASISGSRNSSSTNLNVSRGKRSDSSSSIAALRRAAGDGTGYDLPSPAASVGSRLGREVQNESDARGDEDEYYAGSVSDDETLSDSSDDDVVFLHSKLPGSGTVRGRPSALNGVSEKKLGKPPEVEEPLKTGTIRSALPSPLDGTMNHKNDPLPQAQSSVTGSVGLLPPPATADAIIGDASLLTPFTPNSKTNPLSPALSSKFQSDPNLRRQAEPLTAAPAVDMPPRTPRTPRTPHTPHTPAGTDQVGSLPSERAGSRPGSAPHRPTLPRLNTEQSQLLPGFKISREPSSEADSSTTGSRQNGLSAVGESRPAVDKPKGIAGVSSGKGSAMAVSAALRQLRKGNLTKDFWMKDELCKDCFLCGQRFHAFRRKHHCRLCGQIFCFKCTSLINGGKFSHSGSMRVCDSCCDILNDEDILRSSDSEGDFSPVGAVYKRGNLLESAATTEHILASASTDEPVFRMPNDIRPDKTPLMAIPATRRTAGDNPNRRSQVLEIDADLPSPTRPSSARSMRALTRPLTGHGHGLFGHKHSGSRSHRINSPPDERAPFHRNIADDRGARRTLPAFHADSIIDPDLTPYMSDDDLSDGGQTGIFATIAPKFSEGVGASGMPTPKSPMTATPDDKSTSVTGSAARRRAKSRSIASISGILDSRSPRQSRRRTGSIVGNLPPRPRPKSRGLMRSFGGNPSDPFALGLGISSSSPRASRSASMRGPHAPALELNTASLQHVRKMLKQMLKDAGIEDIDNWEKALMPILLKCTDDLNPDVRTGDSIDIRHYVKIKRIPGGKPCDTSYVSGLVYSKNLALKAFSRQLSMPRIVLVSFPLEYSRHQQQLMSLEPVIAQEREYLQNLVNRIVALRPTLLLVGNNVSRLALQFLHDARIATSIHVKTSVINAVARCAQADIVSSIDKLALSNLRIGKCTNFEVKTYVHDDIPGRKKTFTYLSGCPKELGCTIVLRGADMQTLATIKQITDLMVYVMYNLKLETCLMRDEYITIPSGVTLHETTPNIPSQLTKETTPDPDADKGDSPTVAGEEVGLGIVGVDDGKASEVVSVSEKPKEDQKSQEERQEEKPTEEDPAPMSPLADKLPDDIPNPTYYEDIVRSHDTKVLSASPFVKYTQPYLLMRARELERRLVYLRRLRDGLDVPGNSVDVVIDPEKAAAMEAEAALLEVTRPSEKFQLVQPEMVHGSVKGGTTKAKEVLRAIYDAEYDKALHLYETQRKQWENYLAQSDDLFDPFSHQSIAVLYSMVCTVTTVPCEGPELRRLEFYVSNEDWVAGYSDCTLGQYVEYLCETADHTCASETCDKKMINHHRSYVHGQARVSVLVSDKVACPITGMQNQILMWSYCKICKDRNTPPIPMSESTWKYSFGKYLELAFWSTEMKVRSGDCPHDANREHVRCFGYQGLAVMFEYDSIDLLEIVVPRTKITYKPEIDLRIKNEQYTQIEEKITKFFNSVKARLQSINIESVPQEKMEACTAEIESLHKRADEDRAFLIAKLQEKYEMSTYYQIVPLNRALRALQERVVDWDISFTAFDSNYFPSEKDIRRLATLQLKKIFLENTSTPSLQQSGDEATIHEKDESKPPSIDGTVTPSLENSPVEISSQQAHDALASVLEENQVGPMTQHQAAMTVDQDDSTSLHTVKVDDVTPKQELRFELGNNSEPTDLAQAALTRSPVDVTRPDSRLAAPAGPPPGAGHSAKSKSTSAIEVADMPVVTPPPEKTINNMPPPLTKPRLKQTSSIPRPDSRRRPAPPAFNRTVSVPNVPQTVSGTVTPTTMKTPIAPPPHSNTMPYARTTDSFRAKAVDKVKPDRKLTDKLRLNSLGKSKKDKDTQIPRSIPTFKSRRVSNLAKHFEELSKEFERERARERKQLAAKRSRALPVATSRPMVEVYRNVYEAVEEVEEVSDEEHEEPPQTAKSHQPPTRETSRLTDASENTFKAISPELVSPAGSPPPETEDNPPSAPVLPPNMTQSDIEVSDAEMSMTSDQESVMRVPSIEDVLPPSTDSSTLDLKLSGELPQHRNAWMKMLSTFWAERSASGWSNLEYPLHPTDHVFNDSDIIVREDEPSSLIAFALDNKDYAQKLNDIRNSDNNPASASSDNVHPSSFNVEDHPELERSLLKTTGTHLKYQFQEGSAKMFCKIFYAEQFDALRRNCGIADRYVESLSRCIKWDSKGGKTGSVFLKTQDERIVLKSLRKVETDAFIKFAPAYFQFMGEAFFHELPTVIAKMLGFYQIFIKNPTTGIEVKWDILVMENLFYDRRTTRIFDLKGSMRNRYTQSTGDRNEVLLDENMVEFIYESPLFVREHSKKLLRASLHNDTLFLSRQNVMDYSLMIGIDENKKELVVGIIDCIRTFTWDKKLESWVKEKGFAGTRGKVGGPTVTSPREYKTRFREAMERYVLEAPSCWYLFRMNVMGAVPLQLHSTNTGASSSAAGGNYATITSNSRELVAADE